MKIININNYKIIEIPDNKITEFSRFQWAILPENLAIEIENQKYHDGFFVDDTGIEQPNLVDLGIVEISQLSESEEHKTVLAITFKDKNEAIKKYQSSKFFDKRYKVLVHDLASAFDAGFQNLWLKLKENDNIIKKKLPQKVNENGITLMPVELYFDVINPEDKTAYDYAIANNLIEIADNPALIENLEVDLIINENQ